MASANPPESPSLLRWLRFPIFAALIPCFMIGLLTLAQAVEGLHQAIFPLMMATQMSVFLAFLLILLWWLFYSGVRWGVRLLVLLLVVGAVGGFAASIRKVEFVHSRFLALAPRLEFRWQPTTEDLLDAHRSKQAGDQQDAIDLTIRSDDFPRYRGASADGVAKVAAFATDWAKSPPKELYKQPCGGGYAGFAVAGNVAVTTEQRGDKEVVVCYDRASGRERWKHEHPAYHKDVMGDGPRATPTIHDGLVYNLGALGEFVCLDGRTGDKKWSINVLADNNAKNIEWGLTGSPLVVDGLVVVNAGIDPKEKTTNALAAYDRLTGKKVWSKGKRMASYCSPQFVKLGGVPQILLFDGGGLVSYDPATGDELWSHEWLTSYEMNIVQPLVLGDDRLFITSELNNGASMVRVTMDGDSKKWNVKTDWKNGSFAARFANPVTDGKAIYGLSNGVLTCLDADTGKKLWKGSRYGSGQVLLANDVLVVMTGEGNVALVKADPAAFTELAQRVVLDDKTWNTHTLAGDQLFLRNQSKMAVLQLPKQ